LRRMHAASITYGCGGYVVTTVSDVRRVNG
jgi:hypothetical protein